MPKQSKPDQVVKDFLAFQGLRSQVARLQYEADQHKSALMETLESKGYTDEKGNRWIDLPEPMEFSVFDPETGEYKKKTFSRLQRQVRPKPTFDEDLAMEILEKHDLVEEGTITVTYVDQDAFLMLQQDGKISEKELRSTLGKNTTYAFVPTA